MTENKAHSPSEFAAAAAKVSDLDLARLKKLARRGTRGLREWNWEDLLQEALRRGLEGTRVWPTHVELTAFLAQTMRSVAQEQWQHEHRPAALVKLSSSLKVGTPNPHGGPERELAAAQEIAELCAEFATDAAALAVLDGMGAGESPHEIQERAGLDARAYKAAQKRIRRVVIKKLEAENE